MCNASRRHSLCGVYPDKCSILHSPEVFGKQCHQKPKFANYDYCGKHCAQTAHAQKSTAATKQPAAPPARIQAPQVAYNAPTTKGTVQGNGNQKSVTAPVVGKLVVLIHSCVPTSPLSSLGSTNSCTCACTETSY